jgi:hypothetical protein
VDYRCPACGLAGHVSGGEDAGMLVMTTTIYCLTCETLQDVTVGKPPWTGEESRVDPRCQRRKSHRIQIWHRDLPCPRCGKARMTEDAADFTLWD